MFAHPSTALVTALRRPSARGVVRLLKALAIETDGQDLIEYALLTAFIGLVGVIAWGAMRVSLGLAFNGFNAAVWNLWMPDDPAGGGA